MAATSTTGDEQALVFTLDDQAYCVSIHDVDEIVDRPDDITQLPGTDPHVEGVVDLRGNTTTVVDPKPVLDQPSEGSGERLIVFESAEEEKPVGWIVDEVRQVVGVDEDDLDTSTAGDLSRGVIRNDDGYVVWLRPEQFE